MGDIVKLFHGRVKRGKKIPKPVLCKDCDEPIEAARLQACADDVMKCTRCISCARSQEKRFDREMAAIRDHQSVQIIRR
jgi:RNA polymerase-binding transcription factor DksA